MWLASRARTENFPGTNQKALFVTNVRQTRGESLLVRQNEALLKAAFSFQLPGNPVINKVFHF